MDATGNGASGASEDASPESLKAHARVRGVVQGVGFRWHTQRKAQALELTGWVRNCADGSVELQAFGTAASLEALETWLNSSGAPGRVEQLSFEVSGVASGESSGAAGFEILKTAR